MTTDGQTLRPNPAAVRRIRFATLALELLVAALCVTVVLFWRLIELESIEIGGDALHVWEVARWIVHGGDLPDRFDHHTSRTGLMLPTMAVQWLFGSGATSYFIGPLVAGVLLHLFVYLIGRLVSGALAGALAVCALLAFEPMQRACSQILPESFGPMYTAAALLCAVCYCQTQHRKLRWLWLTLAGLSIFAAYAAKMVYLYYAPGVALMVWLAPPPGGLGTPAFLARQLERLPTKLQALALWVRKRKLGAPLVLTLVVLVLLLIELIFFEVVSKDHTSRIEVVTRTHGIGKGNQIKKAVEFFALYTQAGREWIDAMTAAFLALLGVLAFARDRRAKLLGVALIVYLLLQTFILRKLDPPTPWMRPHPRYLLAMAMPMALLLGIFLNESLRRLLPFPQKLMKYTGPKGPEAAGALIAGALLLFWSADLPERWQRDWGKNSAWHRTERTAERLSAAFSAGIPIATRSRKGKPVDAALLAYIDVELQKRDGALLSKRKLRRKYGAGAYTAKALTLQKVDKKALDNLVQARGRSGQCAIMLAQRNRFFRGNQDFSPRCVSLEKELSEGKGADTKPTKKKRKPRRKK